MVGHVCLCLSLSHFNGDKCHTKGVPVERPPLEPQPGYLGAGRMPTAVPTAARLENYRQFRSLYSTHAHWKHPPTFCFWPSHCLLCATPKLPFLCPLFWVTQTRNLHDTSLLVPHEVLSNLPSQCSLFPSPVPWFSLFVHVWKIYMPFLQLSCSPGSCTLGHS